MWLGVLHAAATTITWLLVVLLVAGGAEGVTSTHPGSVSFPSSAYAFHSDDEITEGRKIYKNPRNAPSDNCPKDDEAVMRAGRTCLRKCSTDADCLSRKKVCLCDGICGMSCIKPDKECSDLDSPAFGFVDVKGKVVGSQANYRCLEGYHLIGHSVRLCQANGIWSSSPPECHENLYCTDPPAIPNARHSGLTGQTRFEVNQTLKYSCYEGYTTKGFDVAKCFLYNNTMQWFGPEIHCEPKTCGDPGEILNGFKEGSCHTFSCRVTYHCRPGFELVGLESLYCQHDGTWNPPDLPACTRVQCDIPDHPANGKATFTRRVYNSLVSYKCDYSYMLVGPVTRRCGPDKEWSGLQPQCKQINCGHPGFLPNGWLENIDQGTALGSSIIFRCFVNMSIEGDQSTVCQADGTWSKPMPKCLAPCIVPEIEFGRLKNSTLAGTSVSHGKVIEVECKDNFELAYSLGPSLCYNGTWTHYPRCQPARCKKLPPRPRHGMVIAPKTEHGMRARYRCRDGFKLHGNTTTTTCYYGNWTGHTPMCKEVYCPFPGEVENGRVLLVGNMGMYDYRAYVKKVRNNRQIRYDCDRGFYLVEGPPGATCVGGRWSPKEMPRCDPDLHPRIRWVRSVDGEEFTEIHNMTLMEGPNITNTAPQIIDANFQGVVATLRQIGEVEVEEDDVEKRPSLSVTSQEAPVTVTVMMVSSKLVSPASEATYQPSSSSTTTTTATPGPTTTPTTTTSSPTTTTTTTRRPPPTTQHPRHPEADDLGRRVKDPLVDFYRLLRTGNEAQGREGVKGDWPELVRVPRGISEKEKRERKEKKKKWKKRGKKAPHCDAIHSEPYLRVEVVRTGRDTNYTYSAGARIKVTCLHGYGLNIGNKTAKCAKGRWKPKKPECVTLPCSVPKAPNGQFDFNGETMAEGATISHGEVVKFTCGDGYTVLGSDTMRCWYGAWAVTGKNPECHPNPCVLPQLDHGGYKAGYKKGLTIIHGSTVEYDCDHGFIMSADDVTCHLGDLKPSPPACVAPARSIMNSAPAPVKREGSSGGDITDIAMSDELKKTCGPPPEVTNAEPLLDGDPLYEKEEEMTSFPHGSLLTYQCEKNFQSVTDKTSWDISCLDGEWEGKLPDAPCIPEKIDYGNKSCKWRKSEPNVVTFYKDTEVTEEGEFPPGTRLVSRCIDIGKYSIKGDKNQTCKHGEWTGSEKPYCVGLNQEHNYALDHPPTILFRNDRGPMAQSNDGKLVVYPDTVLHLECLFTRKYGTPNWNVSLASSIDGPGKKRRRKGSKGKKGKTGSKRGKGFAPYPNGWANAPNRNIQLEYRLSIYRAQPKDSGAYACVTPTGHKHMVTLDIRRVHCANITNLTQSEGSEETSSLRIDPIDDTRMNTVVKLSCDPGWSLVGAQEVKCLPSGNWSAPIPRCEKDKCIPPAPPENGIVTGEGPFHAGDVVEVQCHSNYMMEGQALIVCQEDGTWSEEVPKCLLACTYPGTIISGTMSSVKFYYPINDTITYTCSSGFQLQGARSISCKEGGKWSAPIPMCIHNNQ